MQDALETYKTLQVAPENIAWASSLFPDNFISVLPMNCNRKQFLKQTQAEAVKFYQLLAAQFAQLLALKDKVKTKSSDLNYITVI
jgi:hypothetical protein